MRLLLVTAEPCPTFRADVVGLFGKYLPRFGIYSDVVTTRAPDCEGPIVWGGGAARVCNSSIRSPIKHLQKFLHCAKHFVAARRDVYQAVQVRDMPYLALFCLIVTRTKGLPFFYWMSYPIPEGQMVRARGRAGVGSPKSWLLWWRGCIGKFLLYQLVLPSADHIFVQSEKMKCDLTGIGLTPERITPVPMGVDLAAIHSLELAPSDDERLRGRHALVYLGTLDAPRRIEILFDMLARARRKHPQALLVLIGDTQHKDHLTWLRSKAQEAGVEEHVLWTGWLPMREAWRYVLAGRVGLSPFPRGFLLDSASPTKVTEYLSLGVPVVCNDNPDQKIAIEASGAGLCVPYAAENFAEAVVTLLNENDADRARRVCAGRKYVSTNRDYEVIARKVANVYMTLCPASTGKGLTK